MAAADVLALVQRLDSMRGGLGAPPQAYQPEEADQGPLHQRIRQLASMPNYTGGSQGAGSIPDLAGIKYDGPKGYGTPAMQQAYALAKAKGVTNIGGFADRNIAGTNKKSKHAGKAWDLMVGDNRALGDELAELYVSLAPQLGIENLIWNDRIWSPSKGWRPYKHPSGNTKNPTLQHRDHVHIDWPW